MFKKRLKFEKSKYSVIQIAFCLVILFSFAAILLIIKNNYTRLAIRNFISPVVPITINVEMNDYIKSNVFICYDDICSPLENSFISKVYHSYFQTMYENIEGRKIKNITLAYPRDDKDFFDDMESVDLHIGNKKYYLDKEDLLKIEKKKFNIEVTNSIDDKIEIQEYNTFLLSDKGNYKGIFNNVCCLFLSLFYNWKIFIIPYMWLFLVYIFYLFNKDEIKLRIKFPDKLKIKSKYLPYATFAFIFLAGLLLRLDNIGYYPLWSDEVYTKTVAIRDFFSCFKDAGNPPLFFILEYLITKIIGTSDIALRFLPFVFGCLTIGAVYLLFNTINNGKKPLLPLFAAFMTAINTIFIYHSTEARGYSLSSLLLVLGIYFLFKYLKNPIAKNLIYYGIILALSINHNYYLMFFGFCCFIWGMVNLFENKYKNKLPSFFITNFICALTVLPYLFISSKAALASSFNGWIPPLSRELFKYAINEYFINKYVFLVLAVIVLINLIFIFVPNKFLEKINLKTDPEKNNLLIFLIFSITLVLIISSAASIYIKPVFHKRVLLSIYMLLFLVEIVNLAGIIEFIKENTAVKIVKLIYFLVLSALCFSITKPMPLIEECRLDDFMNLLKNDVPKYERDYSIHAITCDTEEYLEHYPEVKKFNIKWHYINTNSGFHLETLKKFDYINRNEKSVIYVHAIAADVAQIAALNPYLDVFQSNSISSGRLIYNPEN